MAARGSRREFTSAEDDLIRAEVAIGTRSAAVARCLARNDASVRKRAIALGYPFLKKGRPKKAHAARVFSEAQDRLIVIMAGRGWASSEVADRLGRQDASVRCRAKRLGVSFTPKELRGSWVGFLTSSP